MTKCFLKSKYLWLFSDRVDELNLRNSLKQSAVQTNDTPGKIIRENLSSLPSSSTTSIPNKNALRQIIQRARKKNMPEEPTCLSEINIPDDLKEVNGVKFLGRDHEYGNNKRLLLFATESNLRRLSESDMWFVDGTFQTCPALFTQLFSIHCIVGTGDCKRIVPLVYGFLDSKTEESYVTFFSQLKEYSAEFNIELNPGQIMSDFEQAILNAIRIEFPNTIQSGCLFHLGQNIWRKIQACGLSARYGADSNFAVQMRCYVALAYLPAEDIPNIFRQYKDTLFPEEAEDVTRYFEEYYVLGRLISRNIDDKIQVSRLQPLFPPSLWSIERNNHSRLPRTQNSVEAWHRRWNSLLDNKRLGLYGCIRKIIEEQKVTEHKIEKILGNLPQTPPKKKKKVADNAISAILARKNTMGTLEFIRALALSTRIY